MKKLIRGSVASNAHDISALKSQLENACRQYLIDNGFPEVRESRYDVCVDDMMPTIWVSEYDEGFKVEVGMELSYNSLLDLAFNYLDPIIVQYDKDAYFDMEDAGLAVAYLQ